MTRCIRLHFEALIDRCLPSFVAAGEFPVGPSPQGVVTGDFNNDGKLDLATANHGDNTVSVLLGNGLGGFGPATNSTVGTGPLSLAVADFNNDGKLDLAVISQAVIGNIWSNRMSVLLGNGDGTFRAPTSLGGAFGMAAGDFNNDGNIDLVRSLDDGEGFGLLQVLLGNGQGGFSSSSYSNQLDYDPIGLAVADLNRDGNLDAVTADVYVLLGNGSGTLHENSYWYYNGLSDPDPRAVAVGDFTGDRIPDLIVTGQAVHVLPGLGDGMFAPSILHTANGAMHTGVAVADFNGDGKLDAVTSDADSGTVSLLLGNGDGTLWYAGAFAVGASSPSVAVGDFNGDGHPDAVSPNGGSNTVSVLLNDGTWSALPPQLRIHDVTVVEGNSGTADAVFTVTLSTASDRDVTVQYATADGTATAGSDYEARSGQLFIPAGQTSASIVVLAYGDRVAELEKTFSVRLTEPTNAVIGYGIGTGTIADDEPRVYAGGMQVTEGNSGTTNATFTVTLSAAYDQPVAIAYTTADGTATPGSDYQAASGTLNIPVGQTTETIIVRVNGDRLGEGNEFFLVNLSGATNAYIVDGQRVGTILDDEPQVSISDVTRYEGKKNQKTLFTFTVTLSAAYDQPVTMSFQTVNGTATTSDNDYISKTGTLTFAPGETTKTITIEVKGDSKKESNETFYVDLFGLSGNALFTKSRGVGTILNDD